MSPIIFADAISEHRSQLLEWVNSNAARPLIIVADSAAEAIALLALALRAEDGRPSAASDRAVVVSSPDALRRVSAVAPEAILVVADRETELAASGLTRRSRIVIVRPRTSVENDPDIAVEPPNRDTFLKALEDMGIDEELRAQLQDESGLSRTILRRRLAISRELRRPEWASDSSLLRKLTPMLLAGAWNRSIEADRMLVAELAGTTFEQVETNLVELTALPDAPVWGIGNYRGTVSRKDALYVAGHAITEIDAERFFEVADLVLSEDDPALDLEPENRWKANIYEKRREVSGALRAAIGEMLVLLAVDGDRVLGKQLTRVDHRVDALVSRLLKAADARKWLSQRNDLPLLAEAAPRAFLDALDADLSSPEPQTLAMLRPAGAGGFDSPDRSGLLWALETLAWKEDNLFRVGRILARLSEVPIDDNWVNKPEASLRSLVRAWFPQTTAGIDARMSLVDLIVREFPPVGWRLCLAQIDTGDSFAMHNNRPRWRLDAAEASPLAPDEPYRMRRYALDLMLARVDLNSTELGDLIEQSAELPIGDQRRIWALVEKWIDAGPEPSDRAALRERMRCSVLSRRSRHKTKPSQLDKRRREIFLRLAPADPVERHLWLFAQDWVSESGDEIWDDDFDYDKHEQHIESLRREAIAEVVAAHGMEGLERLLTAGNAWGTVGRFLVESVSAGGRAVLIEQVLIRARRGEDPRWSGCLLGMMRSLGQDRQVVMAELVERVPIEDTTFALGKAPFDEETWALVDAMGLDARSQYWRTVAPFGWHHDDAGLATIVERLLEFDRPVAAFNAVTFKYERLEGAMLARLMRAIVKAPSEAEDMQINAGRIGDAMDALQVSGALSVAELAQLEYAFLDALTHMRHGIPNLERQIGAAPADFVHLVSLLFRRDDMGEDSPELNIPDGVDRKLLGRKVFRALEHLKRTPGTREDGVVDSAMLLNWLIDARERFKMAGRSEIGDSQIGQLLGRTGIGSDGIWPNAAVRDALEACGSERMLRGMSIGLFNTRGAVWRGEGGGQERALAEKYRDYARQLGPKYPVTSRMLEGIAEHYDGQADWHDTDEAVRKRLSRR